MSHPVITVVGTLAADPEVKHPASGIDMATFRIASTDRRLDKATQQWQDGTTSWFEIVAFRSHALNALASFKKGHRVIVQGELTMEPWEHEGRTTVKPRIIADALGHELRWGSSVYTRTSGGASAARHAEPEPPQRVESDTSAAPLDRADQWANPGSAPVYGAAPADSALVGAAPAVSTGGQETPF